MSNEKEGKSSYGDEKIRNRFKILVLGDGGVGKTTFLKSLNPVERKYNPTFGVVIYTLKFMTNKGPFIYDAWDIAGEEKFGGVRDEYYTYGDCALIMFDLTNKLSYEHVGRWYRDLVRNIDVQKIPMCLVGTKAERLKDRKVSSVTFHKKKKIEYFEISSRCGFKVNEPLLKISQKMTGMDDLYFISPFQEQSSRIQRIQNVVQVVDKEKIEEMKKLLNEAQNVVLPDSDDDDW